MYLYILIKLANYDVMFLIKTVFCKKKKKKRNGNFYTLTSTILFSLGFKIIRSFCKTRIVEHAVMPISETLFKLANY